MSKKTSQSNPNWPSKNPGNPSGPNRGNNQPKSTPIPKQTITPTPKKK